MKGIETYCRLYPEAVPYLDKVMVEVDRGLLPQPTPWAQTAISWAFQVNKVGDNGIPYVGEELVLHIDEFNANLTDYYASRYNRLMLQIMADFRLGGLFGESVAEGILTWAESNLEESDPVKKKYESFFCLQHNKLCEACPDGKGIVSTTSPHVSP